MRIPDALRPLPAWPAALFPAGLDAGRERLTESLLERVGADGAVRDRCRSRVLESALTLALIDSTEYRDDSARTRIVRYLEHHLDSVDRLNAILAATALGRGTGHPELHRVLEGLIARAPDFTGLRKRALVQALFTMLGATPPGSEPGPGTGAFDLGGLHNWAVVQVTAVKAILAHAADPRQPIDGQDRAMLLSTQQPGTVWEGNLLIHLSVLHALAAEPGSSATVAKGIRTALLHQRADGGLPFVTDTDTWSTVTAGLALHSAGAPWHILHRIAAYLVDVQRPGGGWSYTDRAHLADTDCTTLAVEFLHQQDPHAYATPIRRGLDALIAVRGPDSGFPTYNAGSPSEACMTAAAVNAFSTQGDRHPHLIRPALLYLAGQQRPDGSFPPGWSSSSLHTLFRAYLAAAHQPAQELPRQVRAMTARITDLVRSGQNSDGGFGPQADAPSDAISTAYAVIILSGLPDPVPAARAVDFLLSRQRPDGTIASVPDMLGPRPLPYTVPVLADSCALLALGHLANRLRPARSATLVKPSRRENVRHL